MDSMLLLGVKVALITIFADTLFAWVLAFKQGNFNIKLVPQFLARNVFPYVGALVITAGIATLDESFMPLFAIATAGVTAKFGYEAIKEKLLEIFKN